MKLVNWQNVRGKIREDWKSYRGIILSIGAVWCFLTVIGRGICPMTYLFGLPCPGCGMTRSLLLLLMGQWRQSWEMHPFLAVWAVFVLFMGIERYLLQKNGKWKQIVLILILSGMLLFYLYRMAVFFPGQEPMIYLEENMAAKALPGYRQMIWNLVDKFCR